MFRNLDAEQARLKMTNTQMAMFLGISRASYENKKKTGKFTVPQVVKMLNLFQCEFGYLFEINGTDKKSA